MKELSVEVQRLLAQRYLKPNEDWYGLVSRVVNNICKEETKEYKENVHDQILNRVWLPNSPCLVNAGTKNSGLFACFVVGPDEDTLESHVEALGDIAAVGKRGGGAGFTGTNIRAQGSPVAGSAHGYAYGPNNWAVRVSDYLDMITQGGFRKMALMYTLRSDHPDLDAFIDLKQTIDEKFCYNFNQSVMATDSWMMQAENDHESKAHQQLKKLARNAHTNGEPGLLFHTTINENTPYKNPSCGEIIEATNPCGEQTIPSYGSCNLGSINISHERFFDDAGEFDFYYLREVAHVITRFLDDVGSHNIFPNNKFRDWYENHRPIGVGIMGYADALLKLGLTYGKEDGLKFLEEVMNVIYDASQKESFKLGLERGVPNHCESLGRRNITLLSIAPTGSIGFLAECSHSIEPIFSPTYKRTDERGETYIFRHEARNQPHFRSCVNKDSSKVPNWKEHLDVQIIAQSIVDSAVSKTINLPFEATEDEVYNAFIYAWKHGCKGITVYRDGSRFKQVLDDITDDDSLTQDCPSGICSV